MLYRWTFLGVVTCLCLTTCSMIPQAHAQNAEPATAVQAAKVLDLTKIDLIDPKEKPEDISRSIATLNYDSSASIETVAKKSLESLKAKGWKVLEGESITPAYASASLQKNGFTLTMMAMPGSGAGTTRASLIHQGNVDLKKLATPAGSKVTYALPSMLMLEHEKDADATRAAWKEVFSKAGWVPFGDTTVSFYVRKNAVRLQVMVSPSPMDPKKSMTQISSELLAVDFPALPDVDELQYSDVPTQLSFLSKQPYEECVAALGKSMKAAGWKSTTEQPIKIDFHENWIFRNDVDDMMEYEFKKGEDKTLVRLVYQTAEQVKALNKKVDAIIAEKKAQREAEMKKKANPEAIVIPGLADMKMEKEDAKSLSFTGKSGAARAALKKWLAKQTEDGWEVKTVIDTKEAGEYELTKDRVELHAGFVDPGFIPGTVSISLFGEGKLEIKK